MTVDPRTQTPNGFIGNLFFEELLRQFLAYQFKQIQRDIAAPGDLFFDEMFGRYGDEVRLQAKRWFSENTNLHFIINYPRDNMQIPFVCIVNASETEKTGETYLADDGGQMLIGAHSVVASSNIQTAPSLYGQMFVPDNRPRATQSRQLLSVPESHTTKIYIATENVDATLYLYVTIKALLLANKIDFDRYAGARNMKMSGNDFQHNPELFPSFAYFKVLSLEYDMNFDVALKPDYTIGSVNVSLSSFLFGGAAQGVIQ